MCVQTADLGDTVVGSFLYESLAFDKYSWNGENGDRPHVWETRICW